MSALPIVFSGPRVVVVDKPAGWLSVPSRMGEEDARPCVGITLQEQLGVRLWPTHRLDQEVSGLLLFAKDAEAHRILNTAFESRRIHKHYAALTQGPVPEGVVLGQAVRWECLLLRGKKRAYVHPQGKPAVTLATLQSAELQLGSLTALLAWELEPQTGRAHQLRVELARHGCPIVGDTLYGSRLPYPDGIALRAVRIDLSEVKDAAILGMPARLSVEPQPPNLSMHQAEPRPPGSEG